MTSNKNAYEDIIQTLGFEAVKKLSEKFGGMSIYIPQLKRLMKDVIYPQIAEEFDGGNARRLAVKYGVSERTVYRITKTAMKRKNKNELC